MIGLLLTILIGFGIAFLSMSSTSDITLTVGDYSYSNIPLFVITTGTYLLGMVLAWIIEVPQAIGTAFQIGGLSRTIKSGNNTIRDLQNKINKLEVENGKLNERIKSSAANRQTGGNYQPNIFRNFLHKFNLR